MSFFISSNTDIQTDDVTGLNRLQSFLLSLYCLKIVGTISSCPEP